jgi:hypothetical protein
MRAPHRASRDHRCDIASPHGGVRLPPNVSPHHIHTSHHSTHAPGSAAPAPAGPADAPHAAHERDHATHAAAGAAGTRVARDPQTQGATPSSTPGAAPGHPTATSSAAASGSSAKLAPATTARGPLVTSSPHVGAAAQAVLQVVDNLEFRCVRARARGCVHACERVSVRACVVEVPARRARRHVRPRRGTRQRRGRQGARACAQCVRSAEAVCARRQAVIPASAGRPTIAQHHCRAPPTTNTNTHTASTARASWRVQRRCHSRPQHTRSCTHPHPARTSQRRRHHTCSSSSSSSSTAVLGASR